MQSSPPTKRDLLKALRRLDKNPKTKQKLLGDIGITITGGLLGAGMGGAAATAVGTTSIWGLTTFASWFGITLVSATPIGWTIGASALGAALVYGISRLIRGGAYSEGKLNQIRNEIRDRIREMERKERSGNIQESDVTEFELFLRDPIRRNLIKPESAYKLIKNVEEGKMELHKAYQLVESILMAHN